MNAVSVLISALAEFKICMVSLSLWHSGSVWDSEVGRLGFDSLQGSHCVIEAGGMCKLMVAVTGEQIVLLLYCYIHLFTLTFVIQTVSLPIQSFGENKII